MKNWIKIALGIIGTIVLGAIGSGLWERFLSKIIDNLISLSVELANAIFKSYKDGIYETASLGFHEIYSLQLFATLITLMPMVYFYLIKKHPENTNESSEFDQKAGAFIRGKNGFSLLMLLTAIVTVSCLFTVSKISYTNRVIAYSIRSIDIVKPYISEAEHNMLASQFYQVRSTEDYDEFNKKIKEIAELNSLRLPENAPL